MQIIRYHEIENLIKLYKTIVANMDCLLAEIATIGESELDDYISGMALGNVGLDVDLGVAIDRGHAPSDKTGQLAISYNNRFENENLELFKELNEELNLIKNIINKLDIGFKSIPEETRKIIILKYFDRLNWYEIEDLTLLTKQQCQMRRKKGIETMRVVCRITIDQYQDLMRILSR